MVAVETSDDGRPRRLLLHVVASHDGASVETMAKAHLAPTARVVTDGVGCFRSVTKAGCAHTAIVAAREPEQAEKIPAFRSVNTVLGNIKTAIVSTLKSVAKRHVHRYLAEFQYRFNRRLDLASMLDRLACVAARSAPRPYRAIRLADVVG